MGAQARPAEGPEEARRRASFAWAAFARRGVTHALLLCAAVALVYSNTFDVPLLFDDIQQIVENPAVRSLDAFAATAWVGNPRALAYLTFALDGSLHGGRLWGFHLTNLLVHAAAVLLVYALARALLAAPRLAASSLAPDASLVALGAAAAFAVHPLQTQAVTYVVQRMASLAAVFYLAAVVCYLRARLGGRRPARLGWYAAALAATVAALFTKQHTVTLPFALLLVELGVGEGRLRDRAAALAPFFAVVAVVALRFLGAQGSVTVVAIESVGRGGVATWSPYLLTQLRVIPAYLRMLLAPYGQSIDHALPASSSPLEPAVLAGALFLSALGLAGLWLFARPGRRDPAWGLVGLGVLWWFVTHSVESGVIAIADVMVEHRVYLPSVGILLALALLTALGQRWVARRAPALRLLPAAAAGAALLALAGAAHARNEVWRDEVALWRDATEKSPWNARAFNNLGSALRVARRPAEAVEVLRTAVRLRPTYATAHWNLYKALAEVGRPDLAEASRADAMRLGAAEQVALGKGYLAAGHWRSAVRELTLATAAAPFDGGVRHLLGVAHLEAGEVAAARRELRLASQLSPRDVATLLDLARALRLDGEGAEAGRVEAEARRLAGGVAPGAR